MKQGFRIQHAAAWVGLGAVCAALLLSGCPATTGGQVITDSGKARADREKAARDTRPVMRGERGAAQSAREPEASAAAQGAAVAEEPEAAVAQAVQAEPVAAPTAPLVTDSGGAPAVLVDVVRPGAGGASENYIPVDDEELALVQVRRGGAAYTPQRGMALAIGDEIITSAGSVAVLNYPPNIEIYVMPSTQIQVGSIFVKLGEIWVSIKGQLKEKFKVETEFVTAGVEGTEFLFRADADGAVDVDVVKGAVLCTSKQGRWAPVRMAQLQKFSARREYSKPTMRNLQVADLDRVRMRVKPVSVAVATKLAPRAVIPVSKQVLPASMPIELDRSKPVTDTPIKPEIEKVPDRGSIITKPPAEQLPVTPDIKTAPKRTAPVTKPPAQVPMTPEIKALPKPSAPITKPPTQLPTAPEIRTLPQQSAPMTAPKSTTTPLKTLPKDSDLIRSR